MPKKKRVRCNKTRFVVAMSARASRHPRLTQRLNRRPPFSPRCVFPNLLRHLERQPDVLHDESDSKKKKMGSTFHRGSDFRPLDKLSRYAAIESSRRAFGTHSRASGARCLRAKTVA
jgi:hypothetical protein